MACKGGVVDWRGGTVDLQTIKRQRAAAELPRGKVDKQTCSSDTTVPVTGDWEVEERNRTWYDTTRRRIQSLRQYSRQSGARPGSHKDHISLFIAASIQLGCPTDLLVSRYVTTALMPRTAREPTINKLSPTAAGVLGCTLQGRRGQGCPPVKPPAAGARYTLQIHLIIHDSQPPCFSSLTCDTPNRGTKHVAARGWPVFLLTSFPCSDACCASTDYFIVRDRACLALYPTPPLGHSISQSPKAGSATSPPVTL